MEKPATPPLIKTSSEAYKSVPLAPLMSCELGLDNPTNVKLRSSSQLHNIESNLFAVLRIWKDQDGAIKSSTEPDVPRNAINLLSYLSPQGKNTRKFEYYKRSLVFINIFLEFMEKLGRNVLIRLNLICFRTIFIVQRENKIHSGDGLYMVFPSVNEVPEENNTALVGNDILLLEFLNLTRFLYNFKFDHHRNNFYKLMVITMKTHENIYTWRQEVFEEIRNLLIKQNKQAIDYEINFENQVEKSISEYFFDSQANHKYRDYEGNSGLPELENLPSNQMPELPNVRISPIQTVAEGRRESLKARCTP